MHCWTSVDVQDWKISGAPARELEVLPKGCHMQVGDGVQRVDLDLS